MSDDLVKRLRSPRNIFYEYAVDDGAFLREAADRIEELETKLAKAAEALDEAWFMLTVPHLNYEPEPEEPGLRRIKTTLAELKREDRG